MRDVVAHVISYDDLHTRGLLTLAARGRVRPDRVNDLALARHHAHSEATMESYGGAKN